MSMSDRDGVIWYDGKLVPWRDATTHVLTHSLHYGLSVFEGVRAYRTDHGTVDALRDVSFEVAPGEILAIVGESGSGKTVATRAAMRLLPPNAVVSGRLTCGSLPSMRRTSRGEAATDTTVTTTNKAVARVTSRRTNAVPPSGSSRSRSTSG